MPGDNAQRYGDLAYNARYGSGAFTYDLGLHKMFYIGDRVNIGFRMEAFNVFNHIVFSLPDNSMADPLFGKLTAGSNGRTMQLGLKLTF